MFLDDKLYQCVKENPIKEVDDFQILVNKLYKVCEDHWKPKMIIDFDSRQISYHSLTALLDQIFNGWDLFIKRLEKENWICIDILKLCSYKQTFMNNAECKRIYEKGK